MQAAADGPDSATARWAWLLAEPVACAARRPSVLVGAAPSRARADWEEHVAHLLAAAVPPPPPTGTDTARGDALPATVAMEPASPAAAAALLAAYWRGLAAERGAAARRAAFLAACDPTPPPGTVVTLRRTLPPT